MSAVNIPGFTAEASLYKTSKLYHAVIEITHASGAVYPAQSAVLYNPLAVDPNPLGIYRYCWRFHCSPLIDHHGEVVYVCLWHNICQ